MSEAHRRAFGGDGFFFYIPAEQLLYCFDVYPKNQVSQPLEGLLLRPG
jgi:hypothetical protein